HIKVLGQLDVSERRRPQDGRFSASIDGRSIDLRVAVLPTAHGEDVAVRILDRETGLMDLDRLGVAECQRAQLEGLVHAESGLVLVSGPTGAGKTTTLYAILRKLADGSRKVVTAENPIEFDLPGVNQSQVNHRIGVDYATLVRGILRQDPNVIMLG